MMKSLFTQAFRASAVLLFCAIIAKAEQNYDLSHVDGIESFGGSAGAQDRLAKNGFAVAAPDFDQIFQPYIESPLPVLITADSAWHTYHFLLEQGVKELERSQSERLAAFSRRLVTETEEQASNGAPEFRDLARYAAIGLALQDASYAARLDEGQKRLMESLVAGSGPVQTGIGFLLSPVTFRAQSFYTESPKLTAYYHARQWYANVDFRLSNDRETHLALCLSWLVQNRPELLRLWQELTSPYNGLLALPEDATVTNYVRAATDLFGAKFGLADLKEHGAEIQKKLQLTDMLPRINDQLLQPGEYARFPQVTAGFRLLPARQLPCAICLQNSVDPKIPGRLCPSGLDFFAGSAALRSAAAIRAEEAQFGKSVLADILKTDPGPMPDSLYGRSMALLTTLEKPLPSAVPAAFRTSAWADLQLWTQLGAWAEQRHTWALHAKPAEEFAGLAETPPGIVAPYPDFFRGLAKLSRQTADALVGIPAAQFNARETAVELRDLQAKVQLFMSKRALMDEKEGQKLADIANPYFYFMQTSNAQEVATRQENGRGVSKIPDDLLGRWAESGPTNEAETNVLRVFWEMGREKPVAPTLTDFSVLCDQLTDLAGKELAGKIPTPDEAKWISRYGEKLAGFHFYQGNSWLAPRDDFPIISRIFGIPVKGTVLYSGVARPQALYVILPYKDRMQLYRGAVLSYREFEKPESENLTDEAWQAMVRETNAPPAPPFTASFLQADAPDSNQTNRLNALSFAEADLVKALASPSVKLRVKQTLLASSPAKIVFTYNRERTMSSDDERHVIAVAAQDGKQRLIHDGGVDKLHDAVQAEVISPDGQHVAYVAVDNGVYHVITDGIESKPYTRIGTLSRQYGAFVFSTNGARVAYKAIFPGDQERMVVDGIEGAIYDEIIVDSFSFSANGGHFVYAARLGATGYVVKDGKVVVQCDAGGWQHFHLGPYLSADGEHLACLFQRGSQFFASVDGKESHPWTGIDNAWQTSFTADGRHFSYAAQDQGGFRVVVDDQEFPSAGITPAAFSANGQSWALVNQDETGSWVVVNGVAGKKYPGTILQATFSPDGRRVGYLVEEHSGGGPMAVIHGEHDFENTAPELFWGIQFSPDSAHYSISGKRGAKPVVIIDGKQYPCSDVPGVTGSPVTFSPDGHRWAYPATHGGRSYWVVSGVEYGPYGIASAKKPGFEEAEEAEMNYDEEGLYFSPNGRHFAFRATRDGRHFLVVDGFEREFKDEWFPHSAIVFDSPKKFHFIVRNKQEIDFVEVEIL